MNEGMIAKTMEYKTIDPLCIKYIHYMQKWKMATEALAIAAQVHLYYTYEIGSCGLAMNDTHASIYSNYVL